ncbi:ABC transporter ATP-binding protein [Paracandidimonas soli]|uniref:ABC transporter ATP-binding protein n=1 Tax=Paracandidimonas soli TaxID=1917182 RepID=UPI00334164D5
MTTCPIDEPLLQVRGISKAFGGVKAVNQLDLSVQAGTVTGLIGPNGCGKSTSIDCISGFQPVDSGAILFQGNDISNRSPDAIAHAGLMRTFQNIRIYDDLSVQENLLVSRQEFDRFSWMTAFAGSRAMRDKERQSAEKAQELLEEIGLQRYLKAPAGILSYGQKKLVALAAAMMSDPKLIILDEPLAGVNPTVITRIEALIKNRNEQGQTFLIVEHNMGFVMRSCHHIIVMESGAKLLEGPPDVVRNDERVIDAYLGRARDRKEPA